MTDTTLAAAIEYAAAETTLREVVEALVPLERGPGSPGEREAAIWLRERLEQAGARAVIDEVDFLDGYAPLIGTLCATSAIAGLTALRGGRRLRRAATAVAGLVLAAIADDISNGPRIARRLAIKPKPTTNVIAECGDPDADRTLVVLGHHDAPPTGYIFDDTAQRVVGEFAPGLLERADTSIPLWWIVMSGPGLVALGAARGRRDLIRAGLVISAGATAAFADIARSPIVPGANDNLSALAVLVALAERLRDEPVPGLRVLLVSCGAEEVLQGGIHGFAKRHFPALDRDRTWFVNLDTLGSPRLILLEGEGPVIMEDYPDRTFRDLVARAADEAGAPLRRGMRARNSTDSVVPARAGYPITTLASTDRYKALSNYHKMSDTPEKLVYRTMLHALTVTEAVARTLAAHPWLPH